MNKEQAQAKLNDLQKEVDQLRKIIEEPVSITDRVKTFEDACNELNVFPTSIRCTDTKDEIAYKKLKIICQALNEGWTPDWSDSSQPKYFPWFKYKSGFGFSSAAYDSWGTHSAVGSRLCFETRDLAIYAGKQFQKEYNDFLSL